jgi:hypothetical protein
MNGAQAVIRTLVDARVAASAGQDRPDNSSARADAILKQPPRL